MLKTNSKDLQENIKPTNKVTLTWTNLTAKVQDKIILSNSTGFCAPGDMLAIMGPSGAGKTTLLSLIAANNDKKLTLTGEVKANKVKYTKSSFYGFGAFVFQNDILHQVLTVKQTLTFAAKFRYPNLPDAQRKVEELIGQFQLQKCANTYVGGKFVKGISGGQKKRVSIAIQMVAQPSLIILDEPTSGLDSHIAGKVIKVLKKLSNNGKTVIFTIHQPSFLLYSMLNRVIVLDKGQTIYQGDAQQIGTYMSNLGITIPDKTTISDFFMLQISKFKAKRDNYITPFNNANYKQILQQKIQREYQVVQDNAANAIIESKVASSAAKQFSILLAREWKIFVRNPMKLGGAFANAILFIILWGIVFMSTVSDRRYPDGTRTYYQVVLDFIWVQNACFFGSTFVLMNGIFSVTLVFPAERQVYTKQTSSKTYDTLPYFLSKLMIQLMRLCLGSLLFACGAYWLVGFDYNAIKFFIFCFILLNLSLVANSIGLMSGSLFQDVKKSTALAPLLLMPLMLFGGLYNKLDSIPKWISWMQYLSPFKYGLHSILENQYGNYVYTTSQGIKYHYRQDLGINQSLWECMGITLALSFFYYLLSFIFLKLLNKSISA